MRNRSVEPANESKSPVFSPWVVLGALCSLLPLAFTSPLFAGSYVITDLGSLGGSISHAEGITANGQVFGYSYTAGDTQTHSFLYSNGILTDLSTGYGDHINNLGPLADYADDNDFLYASQLGASGIGSLGGSELEPCDINASGIVVGFASLPGNQQVHAFISTNGQMTDIGTLGGNNSSASAINAAGEITGSSQFVPGANQNLHAFIYFNGHMTDIGTLPTGSNSYGNAINNIGEVVGYSYVDQDVRYHAFLYSNGRMIDLGTSGHDYSWANAINDSGQIVGDYASGNPSYYLNSHPFLYSNGTIIDLNSAVGASSGWDLLDAADINDAGQIVGTGIDPNGFERAFLLTPIPEPPSLGILGFAIFMFSLFLQRRIVVKLA